MKTYVLGRQGQEQMIKNGWSLKCTDRCGETPEEMIERLSAHYSQVKIYEVTTMVKGYHDYIAMVKR